TQSTHLYEQADHLVLGEAEITIPRWLADRAAGRPVHVYACGEQLADITTSPMPRFDLLKFDRYLHVGVPLARGCPFSCEFCDIIELFGRVPRLKTTSQMLAELQRLCDLGYRGHVDFVDDNFIGNKRDVKKFLVLLREWLEEHRWPFEFSTEASVNLADDEELLQRMQDVGFAVVFVGIESPDEATLKATRKMQNTKRSLSDSVQKIYSYGIFVNTGYIVGFDTERGSVAQGILDLIEASATPVNMVGLLFALPNTQLQRRLAREGRLEDGFEVVPGDAGDQCTAGLNFVTKRPRVDLLRDYRRIIDESYAPEAYFGRVLEVGTKLDCSKKKLRLPLRQTAKDLRTFFRLLCRMGMRSSYRSVFWRTLLKLIWRNPRGLRYSVALLALYLHFGDFRNYLVERLGTEIRSAEQAEAAQPEPARRAVGARRAGRHHALRHRCRKAVP
ncbi:MAG: B12-binding domain-containing radical SAM protein, partial [Terriglobia bacterium]